MEKVTKLKTADGHIIHGVLNTSIKKSDILVIFVHGLTGHINEHTFFNAAQQFPKKGVDVFRFSLYTGEKGGRQLSNCAITTHAKDLNKVSSYFRNKYKTISVVGHSLGSPTILKSDVSKVDSIILWDPSYLASRSEDAPKKIVVDKKEMYIMDWGTEYLMNPLMVREWKWFNGKNELDLVVSLGKPLKIIVAGKGVLVKGSKEYFKVAQEPKEITLIAGSTHCFDEEGKEKLLLSETINWIKKHRAK